MSFRLVSKSVTLNDLERRNGHFCVISGTLEAFSAHCVKVVEDIPKLSATEIEAKASSFWRYITYGDIHSGSPPLQQIGAWLKHRNINHRYGDIILQGLLWDEAWHSNTTRPRPLAAPLPCVPAACVVLNI